MDIGTVNSDSAKEVGFRGVLLEGTKSTLAESIWKMVQCQQTDIPKDVQYMLDVLETFYTKYNAETMSSVSMGRPLLFLMIMMLPLPRSSPYQTQ